MKQILEKLCDKQDLNQSEINDFFSKLMTAEIDPIMASSILIALKIKKPTPDEIFTPLSIS